MNFTDKNKAHKDNDGSEAGFRMIDMSDENGYGSANKDFSKGAGTYDSQSKSGSPINYSGMDNFGDERFAGHKGATDIGDQGEVGKDAIDYTATVAKKPLGFRRTEVAETSPNEHGD